MGARVQGWQEPSEEPSPIGRHRCRQPARRRKADYVSGQQWQQRTRTAIRGDRKGSHTVLSVRTVLARRALLARLARHTLGPCRTGVSLQARHAFRPCRARGPIFAGCAVLAVLAGHAGSAVLAVLALRAGLAGLAVLAGSAFNTRLQIANHVISHRGERLERALPLLGLTCCALHRIS